MNPTHAEVFSFDWSYPLAFIWGLLVLPSLAGWGLITGRWLVPGWGEDNIEWGLAAAWGLTAFLVFAGFLMMLSSFCSLFVALFLLTGLALFVWQARSLGIVSFGNSPKGTILKIVCAGLFLLIGLSYAGAVAARLYNQNDDFVAYFSFSKIMLDTGTLLDPFSFRRLGSLGGQPALETLIVAFLPWKYAHTLDTGIALLITLGLVQDRVRGNDNMAWAARFLLVAIALTFPAPHANTASEVTGVVLFIALLRTFEIASLQESVNWRMAFLLGGIATAVGTLRCHNVFAAASIGMGFIAWRFLEAKQDRWKIVREAVLLLIMGAILLLPWCVVTYRSSGAFLYPLFKGTHRPEFETFNLHLSMAATLRFIGGFFVSCNFLLLFSPIFLIKAGPLRRLVLVLGLSILLICSAFISQFTFGDYYDLFRYLIPLGLAFALYAIGIAIAQMVVTGRSHPNPFSIRKIRYGLALVVLAILVQLPGFAARSIQNIARILWASDARNDMVMIPHIAVSTEAADLDYREAFSRIPRGAATLIALDYPFLLNYREHTIYNIDMVGAASPSPGFPYFRGAAAVKAYLLGQGIHYLVLTPFDRPNFIYSRITVQNNQASPVQMSRYYATFQVDFIKNIEELVRTNSLLYSSPNIQVIELKD